MTYSNNKLVQKLFILAITAGTVLTSSSFLQANEPPQGVYQTMNLDADSDGDGVADQDDAFPSDQFESVDNDADGIGANVDFDDNDSSVGYQSFASAVSGMADPALRACIENSHPSASDVSQVTSIHCDPANESEVVSNLSGLEAFKLATTLSLENGGFSDITPISSLVRLTYIYMSNLSLIHI